MSFQQAARDYEEAKARATQAIKLAIAAFDRYVKEVRDEIDRLNAKWTAYEQEYILPCFEWAKEYDIDLKKLVLDNPGHNCVELLVRELGRRSGHAK